MGRSPCIILMGEAVGLEADGGKKVQQRIRGRERERGEERETKRFYAAEFENGQRG